MKIIAVIPAFNEEGRVGKVASRAAQYTDEVIVVDDGSKDCTFNEVSSLARDNIFVLRHRINLGKGAALKTGCIAALSKNADIIILLDADGQHRPEKIPHFISILKKDNIDIVFGARSIGRDMPLAMMLGNKILSLTCSLLFRIYISDTQCGFKAFRASVYPKIEWQSNDYAVETEIVVNTGKHKLRHSELDIETIYKNIYKGTTFVDGIKIFINMLIWRIK